MTGIPDYRELQDGDIVNIDVSVFKDGFHGDLNETFLVGSVDEDGRRLVQCAYRTAHLLYFSFIMRTLSYRYVVVAFRIAGFRGSYGAAGDHVQVFLLRCCTMFRIISIVL